MPSDNLIQTDTNTSPPSAYPRRSASALGAAGGYRQPLNGSKSLDTLKLGLARSVHGAPHNQTDNSLETLSEDESGSESKSRRTSAHLDGFLSPTFGHHPDLPGSRPGSAAQMRELKEQMIGLKGKISTLREQARADSLKRRSLQSLRTPSPFTHARIEQWYAEPQKHSSDNTNTAERSPWNGEVSSVDNGEAGKILNGENAHDPVSAADKPSSPPREYEVPPEEAKIEISPMDSVSISHADPPSHEDPAVDGEGSDDIDDMCTEDGIEPIDDDDDEPSRRSISGYTSESGDSLYHDAYQTPLSHEDREDAFDYEHFFLHSAMGTISQQQFQRRGSVGSDDSVETTKGPISTVNEQEVRPRHHTRRGSGDTTSTTDTFATADEGKKSPVTTAAEAPAGVEESNSSASGEPEPELEPENSSSFGSTNYDDYINGVRARRRHNSVIYRPTRTSLHRPSVSSFESTGTNRSFPLVNVNSKVKMNGGILTPQGSPDQELKSISDTLMNETTSIFSKEGIEGGSTSPIQSLPREDQLLVQRLVASLGRCVLGLSEHDQGSPQHMMMKRRLNEARLILEGGGSTAEE